MTAVSFVFKDSWATHNGIYRCNDRDSTTFEIDFWSDYMWGYEVEAGACDFAGNVMKKTAGGCLTYILGKLVAGFLSFFLGPALAGAVFGFFLGFLAGPFEAGQQRLDRHVGTYPQTRLERLGGGEAKVTSLHGWKRTDLWILVHNYGMDDRCLPPLKNCPVSMA